MSFTDLFNKIIEVILKNEGGYVNNRYDPGGETNFGICKRQYPDIDIKNLTRNGAILIYFNDYWSKMNLSEIKNEELALQIFDMGVNAGPKIAIKIIQRLVGVKPDGDCGPVTIEAINGSDKDLSELYRAERRKYYSDIVRRDPEKQVFIAGWLNRIDHCKFS